MEKYQIMELSQESYHAGVKATQDIGNIAERLGFKKLCIKINTNDKSALGKIGRQIDYFNDWNIIKNSVTFGSILLLQHPFHHKQLTRNKVLNELKYEKKVKIISVVHDVEELRGFRYNGYYANEFNAMLKLADVLIVHNDIMRQWFISKGVEKEKIFSLEIFDYLIDRYYKKDIEYEKSINIAGNLDAKKSNYIDKLGELKDIKIHLYGPNYSGKDRKENNTEYHGSFDMEVIPNEMHRGFGLVWDGDSIDGCTGLAGQYLKYNNPHKLSLYLASGLPVVIWEEAAEAGFIKKNGLGVCVKSLYELNDVFNRTTSFEWSKYVCNVDKVRRKLIKGDFFSNVMAEVMQTIR